MIDSFFDSLPGYIELVMAYLPLILLIAVPVAIFISYQKTKKETNKAIAAAGKLGLRYINVADELKKTKKQDSFLLGLLSGWSPWAMEGAYNDVPVRIELVVKAKQQRYIPYGNRTSVSNPTTTTYSRGTVYTASFKKPLSFDLAVHKKIKMPFGLTGIKTNDEIKTGDEELDQAVTISGSDDNKVWDWLNSNRKMDTLKKLFQEFPFAVIDKNGISFRDSFSKANFDRIKNNLAVLCEAIHELKNE